MHGQAVLPMSFLHPPTNHHQFSTNKTQRKHKQLTDPRHTHSQRNTPPHKQQPLPYKNTKTPPELTTPTPAIALTISSLLKLVNPQSQLLFFFFILFKTEPNPDHNPTQISQVQYRMYVRPEKQPRLKQRR